jgi:outer membrane protein assembly factor BamB
MSKRPAWCLSALLCAAIVLPMTAAPAPAPRPSSDWPQWRGPNRDGISPEKGLLTHWPKGGPRLAWKADKIGQAYSSVAVAGSRIFTMGDRDRGQYVLALDDNDKGKELWAARVGEAWRDGGSRSTPTVDGDFVYALGTHGDLVCLEAATGKEVWRKSYPRDFKGRMMSGWGYSESVLVDGDKVIGTPGGDDAALVALDKRTGEVIWKSQVRGANGAGYASAVVSEGGGMRQYVQWLGSCLVGVSAKDGKLLWRYERTHNGTANIPTPLVRGDLVFCSTGYGAGSALLRLVPKGDGGVEVKEEYFLRANELQNHHGGLVLIGDYVYGGQGHNEGFPICVELMTGKVVWRKDRGPGTGSAAVVYADGNLYFRYQNGIMALIKATPEGYHLEGSFRLPPGTGEPSWQHAAIAHGKLYLRGHTSLLVYDIRATGK